MVAAFRAMATSRHRRGHGSDVLPGQLNRGMLEHDDRRIERERAAETDAKTTAGVQLSDWSIVGRVG